MSRSPNADLKTYARLVLVCFSLLRRAASDWLPDRFAFCGREAVNMKSNAACVPLYTWTAVYLFIMFRRGLWRCVSTAGTSGFPPATRTQSVFAVPCVNFGTTCRCFLTHRDEALERWKDTKHQSGHKLPRDCSWHLGYHFCCCAAVCSQS